MQVAAVVFFWMVTQWQYANWLYFFWKAQGFGKFLIAPRPGPNIVYAKVRCFKHHVCSYDTCIYDATRMYAIRIEAIGIICANQ